MAAEGLGNATIASRLDTPRQVVSKWRKRFLEHGLAGLEEQPRGGRPATFPQRWSWPCLGAMSPLRARHPS